MNDGHGFFISSGQSLDGGAGLDVGLGDLDGDGDLDAFVANGDPLRGRGAPNEIWLNDGHAFFNNSGQDLGNAISQAVTLGDLDGDGDLDVFVANGGEGVLDGQPDEIWINDGSGIFTNSGQRLGSQSSYGAALGDVYQDGLIDIFVAGYHDGNRVWLNDGRGNFTLSSPGFGIENSTDVALGDIDGDGDLDALVANALSMPNRLWLHRGNALEGQAVLDAPNELNAIVSSSQIDLTWSDNAEDESGYQVERSSNGMAEWIQIVELPANSTEYLDTDIYCGHQYYYRVRAYRAVDQNTSPYSNIANAATEVCTLPAPADLSVTKISCSQVQLNWTDVAIDESSYRVEVALDTQESWIEAAILPENSTSYILNGLAWNTDYYFRVRAHRVIDGLYSPYSNTVQIKLDLCHGTVYIPALINAATTH
ncbi:MAG: fibronectin type III domain-containing protein [Anaerolineales bacterium]